MPNWPPFTVALAERNTTGSADLDRTVLPASSAREREVPVLCQLGALAYELLNGAPPARAGYVPITVLSEQGNLLLRQCLQGASGATTGAIFPTATGFVQALSEGTVRAGAAGVVVTSSALVPVPVAALPRQRRPLSPAVVATPSYYDSESASGSRWITRLVVLALLTTGGYAFRKPIADFVNAKFRAATAVSATSQQPAPSAPTPAKTVANPIVTSAPRPATPAATPVIVYVPVPQPQQPQQQPPSMNAGAMMPPPFGQPPPPPFPGGMPPPPPGGRPPRR